MPRLARRPCREAGYALQRNTARLARPYGRPGIPRMSAVPVGGSCSSGCGAAQDSCQTQSTCGGDGDLHRPPLLVPAFLQPEAGFDSKQIQVRLGADSDSTLSRFDLDPTINKICRIIRICRICIYIYIYIYIHIYTQCQICRIRQTCTICPKYRI